MKKISILSFLVWLNISTHCNGQNYEPYISLNEMIEKETYHIQNISEDQLALSEAYLSRGESYILYKENIKAIDDLQKSYDLANQCPKDESTPVALRSLFSLVIAYDNLDMLDKVHEKIDLIKNLLSSCLCSGCQEYESLKSLRNVTFADQPLLGPDRISINECVDRVRGTLDKAQKLISLARIEVQVVLNLLIEDLAIRAEVCCRKGGLWKACLQPLINKWHTWNEKWQVFGIPPDPSWD